jgi:hypothetical protein
MTILKILSFSRKTLGRVFHGCRQASRPENRDTPPHEIASFFTGGRSARGEAHRNVRRAMLASRGASCLFQGRSKSLGDPSQSGGWRLGCLPTHHALDVPPSALQMRWAMNLRSRPSNFGTRASALSRVSAFGLPLSVAVAPGGSLWKSPSVSSGRPRPGGPVAGPIERTGRPG